MKKKEKDKEWKRESEKNKSIHKFGIFLLKLYPCMKNYIN